MSRVMVTIRVKVYLVGIGRLGMMPADPAVRQIILYTLWLIVTITSHSYSVTERVGQLPVTLPLVTVTNNSTTSNCY